MTVNIKNKNNNTVLNSKIENMESNLEILSEKIFTFTRELIELNNQNQFIKNDYKKNPHK